MIYSLDNITPTRTLNLAYIVLDIVFLIVFLLLLGVKKRYATIIWSLIGGVIYFIVDYGFFHLISNSRVISFNGNESEAITALVLLWMSFSYGITNFAFIWLCLKKDKYLKEWLILIIMWWLIAPSLASFDTSNTIITYRTTTKYHYIMAILLIVGYVGLIIKNLLSKDKKINILWLMAIGISVQFAWEISLLINGIRPLNGSSIMTLIVNSLLETNLGMPYIYLIYKAYSLKYNDDLTKIMGKEDV